MRLTEVPRPTAAQIQAAAEAEAAKADPDDYHDFVSGVDNDNRTMMLTAIYAVWNDCDQTVADILWALQDGYGEPGYMPEQGYDWSGIRDSTGPAIRAMYQAIHS